MTEHLVFVDRHLYNLLYYKVRQYTVTSLIVVIMGAIEQISDHTITHPSVMLAAVRGKIHLNISPERAAKHILYTSWY